MVHHSLAVVQTGVKPGPQQPWMVALAMVLSVEADLPVVAPWGRLEAPCLVVPSVEDQRPWSLPLAPSLEPSMEAFLQVEAIHLVVV